LLCLNFNFMHRYIEAVEATASTVFVVSAAAEAEED
jgi:hypothetical protein